jgi:hypothetical protein
MDSDGAALTNGQKRLAPDSTILKIFNQEDSKVATHGEWLSELLREI